MDIRYYSLWAINGPLEQSRLRHQLDQFKRLGLDGVVFHPRFYPGAPAYLGDQYMTMVSDVILYAKSIDLIFWIYDEDGWPSGKVGGSLLKKYPEDRQLWVGLYRAEPKTVLHSFEIDGSIFHLGLRQGEGVDYLRPELAEHFIEMTHERYKEGLLPEAFDHVSAFFCDEPEFGLGHAYEHLPADGAIPWTADLAERYQTRFNEDLLPLLPKLFFNLAGFAAFRLRFHEFLTDCFNESFLEPVNRWCQANGKDLTAHIKGEEHPLFQVPMIGSCSQVYRHMSLPGIDALERDPSNNFYPRQLSSVARQFGNGRCMAEAFGGAGWGAGPEDLERYLLWLGRNGVTDFVFHLSQYELNTSAIRDWPSSQPFHLSWAEVYPDVLRSVREKLRIEIRPPADTLLVAPYRAIMESMHPSEIMSMNIHNGADYAETEAGMINTRFMRQVEKLILAGGEFDITDERTIELEAVMEDDRVRVGACTYSRVICAEDASLDFAFPGPLPAINPALSVKTRPPETISTMSGHEVEWILCGPPRNSFLLEPEFDGAEYAVRLSVDDGCWTSELELCFADLPSAVWCDGVEREIDQANRVVRCEGREVRFTLPQPIETPFLWVKGLFRVRSLSKYQSFGDNMLRTEGPFVLDAETGKLSGTDLIRDGFPFFFGALEVETEIVLEKPCGMLQFQGICADAVEMILDGESFGWHWPSDAVINLGHEVAPGKHAIRLKLVSNAYNHYGPHHYYLGDRHVVSPDQFAGVRNFADPADAPGHTHLPASHFRNYRLPNAILWC